MKARIGKLDPQQLFHTNENKENVSTREVVRVGRINPETVFQNNFEEVLRSPGSAPKIGKLDLCNIFDKSPEEEERIISQRKIGKLKIEVKFQH